VTGELVEEAARRATGVLERCVTPLGFRASATDDGYPEVWARDAMIVLLGVCAAGLGSLEPAARASLETLAAGQSPLGALPISVDAQGRRGTANAGGLDGNLWYIIGHHALHATFGEMALLERNRDSIARAMLWARYQDSDEDGLVETQEAADWADLLASRGKVLYDNVLYLLALRAYAAMARVVELPDGPAHAELAGTVVHQLNALHWVESRDGIWDTASSPALHGAHAESQRLAQLTVAQLWSRPYYLPWVAFRSYGDWCDVLANSLAVLAGVPDPVRRARVLDHFAAVGVAEPYPARSIDPPIQPGDRDWREYYRNGNLNPPHQYHNGGIWPFIGGFLVAALIHAGRRSDAESHLERLAAAVRCGRGGTETWEFNEWHHGVSGRPMGRPLQAWSAAMYLFAYHSVQRGRPVYFDQGGMLGG
jgi:glycogen debranching enzyme